MLKIWNVNIAARLKFYGNNDACRFWGTGVQLCHLFAQSNSIRFEIHGGGRNKTTVSKSSLTWIRWSFNTMNCNNNNFRLGRTIQNGNLSTCIAKSMLDQLANYHMQCSQCSVCFVFHVVIVLFFCIHAVHRCDSFNDYYATNTFRHVFKPSQIQFVQFIH